MVSCFNYSHSNMSLCYFTGDLICIFLMNHDVEHLSMYLYFFLGEISVHVTCPLFQSVAYFIIKL